jgi:DNA polymerase III gamma/tau subunit
MVTGAPRSELVREILSAIAKKDPNAALKNIRKATDENIDARTLARLVIHRMRVVLLLRYAPDIAEMLSKELSEHDLVLAKEIAKEPGVNSDTLRMLLEAHSSMAYATVPHLPLELAVIDICA